jgi:RNA polymerase sigma factor (sigma-70 family)
MSEDGADPWRLRAALTDDLEAWTFLVDEFSTTMWHWARSYRLSREDAEDVCQTVWYQLRDKGHTIEDPRKLPGWLATTTRRAALSVARRQQRPVDAALSIDANDGALAERLVTAETSDEHVTVNDLHARLVEAFSQLSEKCRELLALMWDPQLSYEDVATTLGVSIGSVGPNRQRCLTRLRTLAKVDR